MELKKTRFSIPAAGNFLPKTSQNTTLKTHCGNMCSPERFFKPQPGWIWNLDEPWLKSFDMGFYLEPCTLERPFVHLKQLLLSFFSIGTLCLELLIGALSCTPLKWVMDLCLETSSGTPCSFIRNPHFRILSWNFCLGNASRAPGDHSLRTSWVPPAPVAVPISALVSRGLAGQKPCRSWEGAGETWSFWGESVLLCTIHFLHHTGWDLCNSLCMSIPNTLIITSHEHEDGMKFPPPIHSRNNDVVF